MRICLAASGGGHLRQLLQMVPFAKEHDYYFLTEATPLGLSLENDHKTRFVPHFAFGQRKTIGTLRFIWAGLTNFLASLWHFLICRPDVVISTGAGAAFFTLFLCWLFRRKVVYIESIARVETISLFGKLAARYAGLYLVQWPKLEDQHSKATYCNPFKEANLPEGLEKRDKIFATVGTVMAFDRMVENLDELKQSGVITEEIFAQVGESDISPSTMTTAQTLVQEQLIDHLRESRIAVVHGGSGSMLGAIREGCIVIAMPRQHALGEHYDDHQFELVGAFREMDLVIEARNLEELSAAIVKARTMQPRMIEIDPNSYAGFIRDFIKK